MAQGAGRARTSYRDDLVTTGLSMWFVLGLFLDAWAHNNLTGLESFFTPWHAVFYSGFAATAGWIGWLVWRGRPAGGHPLASIPVGYGPGVLGLPMFAVAGAGDYAWHTIFGIEQELRILFSPTHLLLVTSMVLIVTSPLRSAWADPGLPAAPPLRRILPAVLSLAFASTLVLLFLQYVNALVWSPQGIAAALSDWHTGTASGNSFDTIQLVSSIAVTAVVLLAPLLLLARRWQVPVGAATLLHVAIGALVGAITALDSPAVLGAIVGTGVALDLLLAWLRPAPWRRSRMLAFAALAPLVTWSGYLAVAAIVATPPEPVVELWTGIPVVAALLGLLVAVLGVPSGQPAPDRPVSATPEPGGPLPDGALPDGALPDGALPDGLSRPGDGAAWPLPTRRA
jgi:hypothetical protein